MVDAKRGGLGGRAAKPGSHRKGAPKGSGGQRRQGLEGRGPTPPAEERKGHPAARRAKRVEAPKRGKQTDNTPGGAKRSDGFTGAKRGAGGRAGGPGGRPSTARRPATRTARVEVGPEMVAGRNPVVEALRAGIPASTLYVAVGIDADERVREAVKLASALRIPMLDAQRTELDRYTSGAVHQGLVLQVPNYEYAHPDDVLALATKSGQPPLIVALDGVTDPRNLGAVVRSAAAFGAHGVLIPERRAAGMTASAWKASAGAAARLPVGRATNLNRALAAYKDAGLLVVGLAGGGDVDLSEFEAATEPIVLVVGSEGKGLSRLVQERCDLVVRIPIAAATESLNASVAAGVALYEVARRRAVTG
jgi:23S rRNA (guanosine2251-2'-O)-methyltransferase